MALEGLDRKRLAVAVPRPENTTGTAVAAALGIALPTALTPQQQRDVERLRDRHGLRFDRLWLRIQIRAHREAAALHVRAAANGDTAEVRNLAISALPVIGLHHGQLLIVRG